MELWNIGVMGTQHSATPLPQFCLKVILIILNHMVSNFASGFNYIKSGNFCKTFHTHKHTHMLISFGKRVNRIYSKFMNLRGTIIKIDIKHILIKRYLFIIIQTAKFFNP